LARELLEQHPELTAVTCTTDARAAGARAAAVKLGRDIEITGMNGDTPDAPWFSLPLDFARIGDELYRIAVEMPETGRSKTVRIAPEWTEPTAAVNS
jgi:DNA-binding LacI/PurR family transcriptional regulator